MANIYDVNAAIGQPNIVGAFQQGLSFGQRQREQKIANQQAQQLRNLAPQVVAGDPDAYSQAAAINPQAAQQFQGAGDAQLRRVRGLITYLENADKSGNPQVAQAAWQQYGVPFARQFSQGTEPTANWAEAKPMIEQLKARIALAENQDGSALPTGFREADLAARAAGFQPGTPEYQNYFRVAGGIVGRAPSGGFSFDTIKGADGRERPVRRNPRTGVNEVYDETVQDFVPLGGAGQLGPSMGGRPVPTAAAPSVVPGGAEPAPVAGASTGTIRIGGASDADNATILSAVQAMERANVPRDQIDAFVAAQESRFSATGAPAAQTPRPPSAALGVSRTPEEQAAATTAAQEQARTQAEIDRYRLTTGLKAEQEAAVSLAKQQAETQAQALASLPQVIENADEANGLIDQLINHPGRATATGASSRVDPRNFLPGTEATNFRVLLDQVKGKAFLQAFQSLKGAGAITEPEGQKATAAIARLDTAQTEEAFVQALRDLKDVIETGRRNAIRKASQGGQGAPASSSGRYQVGQIIEANGRRYRVTGGDLNDPDVEEVR